MYATIKYPVKEVDIKAIPRNRMLSLSITQTQKVLCEKSIRQYGLLTPIVLMENPSGELMPLTGENELEILQEMNVDRAEVFITKLKNRSDTCKAILLLSSLQKGLNALSEGLILGELLKTGGYTQKELAENLMKSKSWVSKRLSLAEQLNKNVSEMVLAKQLCPASAQDISRLPSEVQHRFAMEVYTKNIPKSTVERLVTAYNNKATPESVKHEIIKNPTLALEAANPVKIEKCAENTTTTEDIYSRFDATIRLLLKLISEIEVYLSSMTEDDIQKYHRIFPVVFNSLGRFIKMVERFISPGKPNMDGGVCDGC
jgi:ParB family chromosome partitioning protein